MALSGRSTADCLRFVSLDYPVTAVFNGNVLSVNMSKPAQDLEESVLPAGTSTGHQNTDPRNLLRLLGVGAGPDQSHEECKEAHPFPILILAFRLSESELTASTAEFV